MASSELFDKYACHDLPETLWRTNDPYSQAKSSQSDQYLKAASQIRPMSSTELTHAVEQHLNWDSREHSPFISALGDEDHARNWAATRAGNIRTRSDFVNTGPILDLYLFEFETLPLNKYTWIFHARSLYQDLDIDVGQTKHVAEDEFLIFSFVPIKTAVKAKFEYKEDDDGHTFLQVYPRPSPATIHEGDAMWELHVKLNRYSDASQSADRKMRLASKLQHTIKAAEKAGQPVSSNLRHKTRSLAISASIEDHLCEEKKARLLGASYVPWEFSEILYRNAIIKIGLSSKVLDATAAEKRAARKGRDMAEEWTLVATKESKLTSLQPRPDDGSLGLERLTI